MAQACAPALALESVPEVLDDSQSVSDSDSNVESARFGPREEKKMAHQGAAVSL